MVHLALLLLAAALHGQSFANSPVIQLSAPDKAIEVNDVAILEGRPILIWPGLRFHLEDVDSSFSPARAYDVFASGQGRSMSRAGDAYGRAKGSAWATFALINQTGQRQNLVMTHRQPTIEVFELFLLDAGQWKRVSGRHETAKKSFERDRSPSFDLDMPAGETMRFLVRTETAAPIKYLLDVQNREAHRADSKQENVWIALAYALPLVLTLFVSLLRRVEGGGHEPVFIALVAVDLLASAWLIGLLSELMPRVSGWTLRWTGQIAYALLLWFLCWHLRKFLDLKRSFPAGGLLLRLTGWLGFIVILILLATSLRLGAAATMPILLSGVLVCTGVCTIAWRRGTPFAGTYMLALLVYLLTSFAYILYYLGMAPIQFFGVSAFLQNGGICLIMSVAMARSLMAKDLRLQTALAQAESQRGEIQVLAMERDRLFAAANHDLRQPLQAVALNLELMRQFEIHPEQRIISGRMRLALASMSNMLSSFLDLRRSASGEEKAPLRPVALGPVLDRLGQEYREHARAKGLTLRTINTSTWVISDPLLLERAIRNLLTNALRYTDQGRILMGVRRYGSRLGVLVMDSGRGISPEQLSELFKEGVHGSGQPGISRPGTSQAGASQPSSGKAPLARGIHALAGADSGHESYGLGLYIVKTIAAQLNANVTVDSTPGKGSTFQILMPRCAAPDARPLTGQNILLVDDDPELLSTLSKVLSDRGATLLTAGDAASATQLLKNNLTFTAVICDFDLGNDQNGLHILELAQRLQPAARKVLMSGRSKSEIFLAADKDYSWLIWQPKPIDSGQLIDTLSNFAAPETGR